jgi:serine phosphatase RsbU (regulator of sigma subunit)
MRWRSSEVALGTEWSVLMYTDGLIEGRIGAGTERLGSDGLIRLAEAELTATPAASNGRQARDHQLIDSLVEQVRVLNGGELDDDLAALALGYPATSSR